MSDWFLIRLAKSYCVTYLRFNRIGDWILAKVDRLYRIRLGPEWSLVLAFVAWGRGSSYVARPPSEVESVEGLVAGSFVPYQLWGWLILGSAVLYVVGSVMEPDPRNKRHTSRHRFTRAELVGTHLAGIGHTIGLGCWATLALSSLASSLLNGLPWSAVAGYTVAGLLHLVRVKECLQTTQIAKTRRFLLDGQEGDDR